MNAMTVSAKRARLLGVVGVFAVGGLVTAVVTLAREDGPDAQRSQAGGAATESMPGMDMGGMRVPVDGSVRLTADQIRQFGVTFDFVELRPLADEVRTAGIVNFDETRIAHVTPKIGGFIERLYVDFTGQPVRAGQPLLELYSPELVAAQEELLLAARLERTLGESSVPGMTGAPSDLVGAARRRLRLWDISEAQIEEILSSGRARRTLTLHAPVSGIVVEKTALQGHAVQPGESLYQVADLSRVWIEAEVRETAASLVREGALATVELTAYPGRPLFGRVEYVYPTLQSETRTLKARIAVPNADGRLRPGMYATVRVSAPQESALTVPTSALLRTGERHIVFADMGGGRLLPHEVELGRVSGEYAEVLAGVEPGQRVVTSAQFLLDSESNLAEVMRAMMAQMNTSDMGSMDMGGMEMSGMEGMDMKSLPAPTRPR